MDELANGLAISVSGAVRELALRRCREDVVRWGLVLPPVEPLVLDFGLNEFNRTGLIEYWIANEAGAGYCGKYLFVFRGQTCPRHRHKVKHETFFLLEGRLEVEYGGNIFQLERGQVQPIEPGCYHQFMGLEASLLLELSMPCSVDDNYFENTAIPIGGNYCTNRPSHQSR